MPDKGSLELVIRVLIVRFCTLKFGLMGRLLIQIGIFRGVDQKRTKTEILL